MARYTPDVLFIGSIYPGQLPDIRRNYGRSLAEKGVGVERSTLFHLDPVPRGQRLFILPIYDSFESVLDIMAMSAHAGRPEKPRMPKPVAVEEIMADLLKEWTGGLFNVPSGTKPGVGQISLLKQQVREFNETGKLPSGIADQELEQLKTQQTLYFEYLFTEGERLHKQSNWKEITDTMRLAADWLGYAREWSHKAIAKDSAPCPLCTSLVPNAAIICPSCHHQIKAMPPELASLGAARPPAA
jgi:hypothetical protein